MCKWTKKKKKKKRKEKKRRRGLWAWTNPLCTCTRVFLANQLLHFLLSSFLSILGKKILVVLGRKHSDPTIYFPFSLPNQTHSKKVFLSIFSPIFSIHLILPPNKHTLMELLLANILFLL